MALETFMMVVGVDPHKQTRWTARRLPVQPWVAAISACRAGALVMPSFCRWLIQGLNGSSLLSRLVALTSSGAASGWRANRLMVSGSRPRMRAASRWECPACSSSCTAAWRSRVRATRARSRPHTSSIPSGPAGARRAWRPAVPAARAAHPPLARPGPRRLRQQGSRGARRLLCRRIRPGCATGASGRRPAPRPGRPRQRRLMAQSGIRTVRMPAAGTRESDDRDVSCVA